MGRSGRGVSSLGAPGTHLSWADDPVLPLLTVLVAGLATEWNGVLPGGLGHEVAGSHNKRGRVNESFTIVGLLRGVIDTYEHAAFRAWQELEGTIAGKRRKFLTWSDGAQELRARAGHGRRDKSDD